VSSKRVVLLSGGKEDKKIQQKYTEIIFFLSTFSLLSLSKVQRFSLSLKTKKPHLGFSFLL